MYAAKLDRYLRIERPVVTGDGEYGPVVLSWVLVEEAWAEVRDILPSKGEAIAGGFDVAKRPARVRMRYRTDIDNTMRLVDPERNGRIMEVITLPAELGRREAIEFMVQEYTTRGDA